MIQIHIPLLSLLLKKKSAFGIRKLRVGVWGPLKQAQPPIP